MLNKDILVSVVIPTYQRSTNLKRAITSVLTQSYQNIEVLVVDDNPPKTEHRKKTEACMQEYQNDSRILYIKHADNLNGAAARNTGINNSKGELIAFLDDDDEWEKHKLNKQVKYLQNNNTYDACYCLSKKFTNGLPYLHTQYKKNGNLTADLLSLKSEIYTPSLTFKKKALLKIGCFDDSFTRHQDFELLVKYFRTFKIGCIPEYLVRVHADDTTNHLAFDRFEALKLKFLDTFSSDIIKLPKTDQKEIFKEHYFELSLYALKKKKLLKSILYLIKSKPGILFLWRKKDKFKALIKKKSNTNDSA